MALVTTKAVVKAISMFGPEIKTSNIAILIAAICSIPVIFIVGIFSNRGLSDDADNYEKAFREIGCSYEYIYLLEDIRFFDSYTYPSDNDSQPTVDRLADRMEQDYYTIQTLSTVTGTMVTPTTKKVCLLKSDEEIFEILHTKYKVAENLKEEILDSVQQMRNGRYNFNLPVSNADIEADYDPQNNKGILFSVEVNKDIFPVAEGTIIDIYTDRTYGLCVVVQHEVIKGINKDGENDTTTMYSKYTNLKNVKYSEGKELIATDPIGKANNDTFFFELKDKDKKEVNPHEYLYIPSGGILTSPFDDPYSISSPFGNRNIDDGTGQNFHFGTDFVKEYGAPIKSVSEGVVIETNSTCAPNGGPTKCPKNGGVPWGGNYVVIKTKRDGVDYYLAYDHMKEINASVDQHVYSGQIIGYQGNSGNSYGSHMHLEIHTGGINTANKATAVNPEEWLKSNDTNNKDDKKEATK